jgi:hypothetical protein
MAGYSGKPLVSKLGIKPEFNVTIINPPNDLSRNLELPVGVTVNATSRRALDCALLFVKTEKELRRNFSRVASKLKPAGMIWVAWPKKSSGVATDLAFTNVQAIGLAAGLVDTKICAVNEIWSGLKFVFRLKNRERVSQAQQ